ncbi:imidazoleglycerol-phosphate dehydratase [Yoonia sp.]|jgi:hypothetical protein|uniref:imidazoleglycerol-phosphate dehydratase n=1 Tax=Yoonia sp. TaxID=2212373 RepID=UPI0025DAAD15|nr:imidazoleglycerol-phosphate dehydratase [Yoonia sp.]
MKALILRSEAESAAACAQALINKGFQVLCVETRRVAHALIQLDTVDLLVLEERIDGQLTHALALSAERRNPYASVIIVTDRPGAETDELYDLIPCLYGVIGTQSSAALVSQLALSSTENFEEAQARVRRHASRYVDEDAHDDAWQMTEQELSAEGDEHIGADFSDTASANAPDPLPDAPNAFDEAQFVVFTATHSFMQAGTMAAPDDATRSAAR